jgi:hypothetical protein
VGREGVDGGDDDTSEGEGWRDTKVGGGAMGSLGRDEI